MLHMERIRFSGTTDASGVASVTTSNQISGIRGKVLCIQLDLDAFDATADITIAGATSGQTIWTRSNSAADAIVYPQATAVNTSNSAITNSHVPVCILGEEVTLTIAQSGSTKAYTIDVWVERDN